MQYETVDLVRGDVGLVLVLLDDDDDLDPGPCCDIDEGPPISPASTTLY